MLGPFKNRLIEDAFKQFDEVQTRQEQCWIIGWLIENGHDLTQDQLNYLADLIISPFKKKRGRGPNTKRHWQIISELRKKFDKDGIILTYKEVIDFIKKKSPEASDESSYRAIYEQIKDYVWHIPGQKGRPRKNSK